MFTDYKKKYLRRKLSFRKARFKSLLAFVILTTSNSRKKVKMSNCGGSGCTNWEDKNSNVTTIVGIMMMLL